MFPSSSHALPRTAHSTFDIGEMIAITTKLNEILLEENTLLRAMKVKCIGPLQEEKIKLGQRLESFQRALATDESVLQDTAPDMRDALLSITHTMLNNAEETLYRTTIARSVNQRVMQTIIDAMAEQQRLGTYSNQGQTHSGSDVALSVNLNERA